MDDVMIAALIIYSLLVFVTNLEVFFWFFRGCFVILVVKYDIFVVLTYTWVSQGVNP